MRDWLLLCVLALLVSGAVAGAQEKAQRRQAEAARPQVGQVRPDSAVPRTYRIRRGDSLASIARRTLGRAASYREILKANPGLKPSTLRVGQLIRLPHGARQATAQSPDAARALRRARQMIQAAERSHDAKAAQRALDEAEKSLMEARKALWKKQRTQRQQGKDKKKAGVVSKRKARAARPPRAGAPIGTFFQVFSGPF